MTTYQIAEDAQAAVADITDAIIDFEIPVYTGALTAQYNGMTLQPASYEELSQQVFGIIKHSALWVAINDYADVSGPHGIATDQMWHRIDIFWGDASGVHCAEYFFLVPQSVLLGVWNRQETTWVVAFAQPDGTYRYGFSYKPVDVKDAAVFPTEAAALAKIPSLKQHPLWGSEWEIAPVSLGKARQWAEGRYWYA